MFSARLVLWYEEVLKGPGHTILWPFLCCVPFFLSIVKDALLRGDGQKGSEPHELPSAIVLPALFSAVLIVSSSHVVDEMQSSRLE